MAMMVYPKQLGRWWSENVIMRFRKLLGVDKAWVEAGDRFMEKDPLASKLLWIYRVIAFVFVVLFIIAVSILMLILLGSILELFR
jgi:hypothetical protein